MAGCVKKQGDEDVTAARLPYRQRPGTRRSCEQEVGFRESAHLQKTHFRGDAVAHC